VREIYRVAVAITIVVAVSGLRLLDKVDNSLLSAVLFAIIGYYFGRAEPIIVKKLRGGG